MICTSAARSLGHLMIASRLLISNRCGLGMKACARALMAVGENMPKLVPLVKIII